ncbi:hypothetical protein RR48_05862 [Papilio machaon]|uniref:Mutant cadherin n=1 Tax=Papilio machaon TaxID=76193 RepID=A0A0N0PD70_PAPMA|nr:hypothetical protein RR48_05862 [Papilio machaon]
MASSTLKCANCNIVINELLAFIQNKADVMDEASLIRLCSDSFMESEILTAKKLLFESIPTSKRRIRKNKGKNARDIDDIICLLKLTDPEIVPIFVARDLQKLPPVTFDHIDVTKVLKDIIVLQSDIKFFKSNVATTSQLLELRMELDNLKSTSILPNNYDFINRRRGGFAADFENFDSGPMALQQHSDSGNKDKSLKSPPQSHTSNYSPKYAGIEKNMISTTQSIDVATQSAAGFVHERNVASPVPLPQRQDNVSHTSSLEQVVSEEGQINKQYATPTMSNNPTNSNVNNNVSTISRGNECLSMAEVLKASNESNPILKEKEKWKVVTKRRQKKSTVSGNMGKAYVGPEGKFKAAIVKVPLYISNVCKQTSERDIIAYVKDKTEEDITLYKINRRQEKRYNSYKLYVPKTKLEVFLDNKFWPDGISFRRFVNEAYESKNGRLEQTS